MGLGGYIKTWQRQLLDFGHREADQYTCLACDNRGMGASSKPLLRYTTSEMAKDIVELLDHLNWKERRSFHVVGISMGGMIAQELVRSRRWSAAFGQLTYVGPSNPREDLQFESHIDSTTNCPHTSLAGQSEESNTAHDAQNA